MAEAIGEADARERIRRALVELCAERGFAEVTLPLLVDRAGVDAERFARHYEGLEDCFLDVYVDMREEFMHAVGAAFATRESWRERMRAAAHAMLLFLLEDEVRARISFVDVLYAGERPMLVRDETMRALFTMIDLGRSEPAAPPHLTYATAETIGSAIYQRIQTALEHRDLEAMVRGTPEMMCFAVLPYLGPEAAAEELRAPPPGRAGGGGEGGR